MATKDISTIQPPFFVKSFEKDFATKTIIGSKKTTFQTLGDIIKTGTIKPNTKSFGYKKRLSCTLLHKNYTKTYRSQGIIFTTKTTPDYIAPFDIVLLAQTNNIITQYYRIENNLHLYYNHTLIPGFKSFIFRNISMMIKKISDPKQAWRMVNEFRKTAGYGTLSKKKYRLVQYNEVIFHKPVKINPIAIYGYTKESREQARKYGLRHFTSAKVFYRKFGN